MARRLSLKEAIRRFRQDDWWFHCYEPIHLGGVWLWSRGLTAAIMVVARSQPDVAFVDYLSKRTYLVLFTGGLVAMGNKLLARATNGRAGRRTSVNPLPSPFVKKYPIVAAFLAEEVDAEDQPRERSKVTVFIDNGDLRLALSDPSNRQSLYVTILDPSEVWEALEQALAADKLDWRPWKSTPAKSPGSSGVAKGKGRQ